LYSGEVWVGVIGKRYGKKTSKKTKRKKTHKQIK